MKKTKVAIIGAGPAGIACAIQLKRYDISPILLEKSQIGGLLINANLVENYMGFETGISGKDLIEKFEKNLQYSEIKTFMTEAKKISFSDDTFVIETDNETFESEILVVASGTKPKTFDFPVPKDLKEKILYGIPCLNKINCTDKKFVIIGAGDAAFDYAINLVNNYNALEVIILNRNDKAKCLPVLETRTKEINKIKHIKNIKINVIEKNDNKIILSCSKENKKVEIETDYIMSAIGRDPCLDFLNSELSNTSLMLQNKRRLYFIGDVANNQYRQTSIAIGNGIKTAMEIAENY